MNPITLRILTADDLGEGRLVAVVEVVEGKVYSAASGVFRCATRNGEWKLAEIGHTSNPRDDRGLIGLLTTRPSDPLTDGDVLREVVVAT